MEIAALPFREVWAVDFEFIAQPGEVPVPVCMVAKELISGRTIRMWQDELLQQTEAPFDTSAETLFLAYYASAEFGCFLALGWSLPVRIIGRVFRTGNHADTGHRNVGKSRQCRARARR